MHICTLPLLDWPSSKPIPESSTVHQENQFPHRIPLGIQVRSGRNFYSSFPCLPCLAQLWKETLMYCWMAVPIHIILFTQILHSYRILHSRNLLSLSQIDDNILLVITELLEKVVPKKKMLLEKKVPKRICQKPGYNTQITPSLLHFFTSSVSWMTSCWLDSSSN